MSCALVSEVRAQSGSTRIVRLEVDKKEVKKSYRIFFLSQGRWIEAQKTADGFILPRAVQNEENVTLRITFGKYKLEFAGVHISNFAVNWIVGVDKKPFSEDLVDSEQNAEREIEAVYYIVFEGEPDRRVTVMKWKKRSQ